MAYSPVASKRGGYEAGDGGLDMSPNSLGRSAKRAVCPENLLFRHA
jgi:hypothetical protein